MQKYITDLIFIGFLFWEFGTELHFGLSFSLAAI